MERKQNHPQRFASSLPILILVGVSTVLGILFSIYVPIFEASDEVWHYPMVEHIARTWSLPVQPLEPGTSSGPWRQEASQPPLYYAIGAALTSRIDTSDLEQVRHLNPHVAAGEITPDGSNPNLVVHNPALERFPWKGTVLAIHIVRLFSVALGAWAVYLTWAIARELYPDLPWLALTAAAIHAFTPMYLFISSSVNNDNLIVPLCSWALLLMVRLVKDARSQKPKVKNYALLGIAIGLGLLTKASALGLLPLAAATVAWETWQRIKLQIANNKSAGNQHPATSSFDRSSSLRSELPTRTQCAQQPVTGNQRPATSNQLPLVVLGALRDGLLILIPALAISGWWFYRNFRLYGDWLGFNAFYAVLGTRDVPADFAQLWSERFAFAAGYWGNFGGLNVPMPTLIYKMLNIIAVLAAAGVLLRFVGWIFSKPEDGTSPLRRHLWPFAWDTITAARALAWAWPAAVFVSWTRWAAITWSSQGRLVFSAISMWSLALALGLRITNHELRITNILHGTQYVLPFSLFLLCAAALPTWIVPAYTPPAATRAELTTPPLRADFGHVLRLTGFEIDRRNTYPGETVGLTLQWEALGATATDHSLFIHVLGEGERIIAQRDTFPGRGLISTTWLEASHTWLEPGRTWLEHYEIAVPPLAYAPDSLMFAVGVVETATGARLPVQAVTPLAVTPAGDAVTFGDVWLTEVPEPPDVHFGRGIALTGYDLDDLIVARGDPLAVTLDWRCDAPIDGDYTISVQLIDDQWRKAAQSDAWPLDGAAPTSSWQTGQILTETRALTIAADAAPGVYDLRLSVYRPTDDGDLEHLPIVWEPGQMPAKSVVLTRVRVP